MVRTSHKTRGKGMHVYAIRKANGQFKNIENIGKCIKADSRNNAKTIVKPGYGYMGDLAVTVRKHKRMI